MTRLLEAGVRGFSRHGSGGDMKRFIGLILLCCAAASAHASEAGADPIRQVEQYNFSIHILAMLLVGFGFLMVFVKRYGYGATTGTYLVVASAIPLYLLLRSWGGLSSEPFRRTARRRSSSRSSRAPRP